MVVAKTTMGIRKKVSILQDPDESMVDYTLYNLTETTQETNGPVTSCEKGIFSGFEDGCYNCLSPGGGELVLLPYTVVHRRIVSS
jgi:hypothetical protein